MASKQRAIYWDTSVFLCFLRKHESERRAICEDILRHAHDGKVSLYTSSFTVTEVIKPLRMETTGPRPLSSDEARRSAGNVSLALAKKNRPRSSRGARRCKSGTQLRLDGRRSNPCCVSNRRQSGRAPAMGAERGARKSKSARCCGGAANAHRRRHAPSSVKRQFFRKSSPRQGCQRSITLRNTGVSNTRLGYLPSSP
jgi:hypothetical protein